MPAVDEVKLNPWKPTVIGFGLALAMLRYRQRRGVMKAVETRKIVVREIPDAEMRETT